MKNNLFFIFVSIFLLLVLMFITSCFSKDKNLSERLIIVNHNCIKLSDIPQEWIEEAKDNLHIAYGHTSHGSQITGGMAVLDEFMGGNDLYIYNDGGTGGALDLQEGDGYGDGPLDHDCGYYPNWVEETREFLEDTANSYVNVIIWSWCGQVSSRTEGAMLDTYLSPMSDLEKDYPDVRFVYMTGHLDGTGLTGNLHLRNEQIREYCRQNDKILYDFADIETYDPDGNYYGDKIPNDACEYDSDGDGRRESNWAIEWQNSHTEGEDWYNCSAAHTQPLNANMKAYAAWWLWARLAGWEGE